MRSRVPIFLSLAGRSLPICSSFGKDELDEAVRASDAPTLAALTNALAGNLNQITESVGDAAGTAVDIANAATKAMVPQFPTDVFKPALKQAGNTHTAWIRKLTFTTTLVVVGGIRPSRVEPVRGSRSSVKRSSSSRLAMRPGGG
jgi:hypothetical protein